MASDLHDGVRVARASFNQFARRAPAALALALAVSACETVTPATPAYVTPPSPGVYGSEVVTVSSPGGQGSTVVTAFNQYGGPTFFAWSWSSDGVNWNPENAGTTADIFANIGPAEDQLNWRGDPGLAAAQDGSGVVVAANIANRVSDPSHLGLVVTEISFDNGRSFQRNEPVNTGACKGGSQDQEAVAYDPVPDPATGNPVFWCVHHPIVIAEITAS